MESIDTNITAIYSSLYNMIDRRITIWNNENISGYLINKYEYYLFQPNNNNEKSLPLYYRNKVTTGNIQRYIPLENNLFEDRNKKSEKVYIYEQVISELSDKLSGEGFIKEDYSFDSYINNFKESNYSDIYFDRLLYEEKVVLLKDIVKEYIDNGTVDDKLRSNIFKHFQNNLIQKVNGDFKVLDKNIKNQLTNLLNHEKLEANQKLMLMPI